MQYHFCYKAVDQILYDIQSNNRLFDSLPMVMEGDFAQILPIVCRGIRATIIGACIQRSYIWPQFFFLFLRQNMRLFHNANN